MSGKPRRWIFALTAGATLAFVSVGGVSFGASLRASPKAPQFPASHPAVHAHAVAQRSVMRRAARQARHGLAAAVAHRAGAGTRASVRTPADDQYGNPLEGKLCADHTTLSYAIYPDGAGGNFNFITNCGETDLLVEMTQSNPDSLFLSIKTFSERYEDCPGNFELPSSLLLSPGKTCIADIAFVPNARGLRPPPPGEYDDDWTYSGGAGVSLTVHLLGRLLDPARDGVLCADQSPLSFTGHSENEAVLIVWNCGKVPVNLGPYQKADPGSPFNAIDTIFDNSNQCPIPGGPPGTLTLAPNDKCMLRIGVGPTTPGVGYTDTWTFPGDTASLTLPLTRPAP